MRGLPVPGPDGKRHINFSAIDLPDVELTPEERDDRIAFADELAERARGKRWEHLLRIYYPGSKERGFVAEAAVAKLIGGRANRDPNAFKRGGDVIGAAGIYDVRCPLSYTGDLVIRDGDPDDRPFVLAVPMDGALLRWRVWGWITPGEVKASRCKEDRGGRGYPARFQPAGSLHSMRELIEREEAARR